MVKKDQIKQLERKGLIEALGLQEDELFDAKFNLLGFFSTLDKIDQRLKKEGRAGKKEGRGGND